MLGQELDRPETWDQSSGTFQSKNNKTNRVQKKKNLLNSLKTKCFSFIKPHSLIELQITLHILHVYKIHCMYCRLHMCSPVLRHITYIPHSIKLFFLHILKHFSTYKMSLSDYENKKSFRQSLGCYKHYNFNETKKYCSKRQMLNLSCAEEKLRGQSTCVLHISFFRVLL